MLISTIAIGFFNANSAHTLDEYEEQNKSYKNGTDMVLKEEFTNNSSTVKYR